MKKVIAWLLVLILTVAVSIGATLAYLTDTDEDVNVMTLGQVKIDQLEYERKDAEAENQDASVQEFHDNKSLIPAVTKDGFDYTTGDSYVDWEQIGKEDYASEIWDPSKINNEVDKMVFVKNKGDYDAYVRSVIAFEANGYTPEEFKKLFHLNINETDWSWEWVPTTVAIPGADGNTNYVVAVATYNKVLEPGKLTEISLSQIALDSIADNADIEGFGDTYQVLVKSQAIQADGFADPGTALNEGFGEITADNIPWDSDIPTKGTDVFTAMNYLNGGTEQITKKVSNITFGLTADYADIALQNKGTLVDVEQDVPVYAYYVPNGSNYDVYLLASDTIYAPTDCSNLCNGMSNLVSFDTSNLDFSRTTNMFRMLRDCGMLSEIDVSDWDTSNVTNMRDLFRACKSIPALDVSEWETGKVETTLATFQDCALLEELDLNNWDVSRVTDASQMFNRCYKLKTLKLDRWSPKNLSIGTIMFQWCTALTELDLSHWDTSSMTTANGMFNHCESLTELNVSTWDMSKVTDVSLMFQACYELEQLDLSKWNTSSAVNMNSMFYGCYKLKELNVGSWDVSNVMNFYQTFVNCYALEHLHGLGNWITSSATDMRNTFHGCESLKELDLSGFDTRKVTKMSGILYDVKNLEKLVLGENFKFDGNGNMPAGEYPAFPAPAAVEGSDGKWYNAETGVGYTRNELPEGAATYVAVNPNL